MITLLRVSNYNTKLPFSVTYFWIEIKPPLHRYFVFSTKVLQFFTVYVDIVGGLDKSNSGPFSLDKFLFLATSHWNCHFFQKNTNIRCNGALSSILVVFQKSQIYTNSATLSSTFSQFWANPKSPKFLKLHFDVFGDFLNENFIQKKKLLSGVIKVFFLW